MMMRMYPGATKRNAAADRCRKSFVCLLNEPGLSDGERLLELERLKGEIEGAIAQLRRTAPCVAVSALDADDLVAVRI